MEYPGIRRRYLATLIDSILIISFLIMSSTMIGSNNETDRLIRIAVFVFAIFIFEPLLTSKLYTPGQKMVGIRVRNVNTLENLSLTEAFVRFITKVIFGFVSLFTIIITENRRAIHDFAGKSIVVNAEDSYSVAAIEN